MKKAELEKIASELWDLERKCQNGENESDIMDEMDKKINHLSIKDIFALSELMEEQCCKNKKI